MKGAHLRKEHMLGTSSVKIVWIVINYRAKYMQNLFREDGSFTLVVRGRDRPDAQHLLPAVRALAKVHCHLEQDPKSNPSPNISTR